VSKLRIVLVGDARDRDRLRASVAVAFEIVGEASTMEAAQALGVGSDLLFVRSNGQKTDLTPPVEPLTPRELEVLNLLAEGLPNKAIAARLQISDQTVKFHVASICGKLGVGNRTSAVRAAVRRGWLTF
jgi:DNA-binding CsgD family transcriptional regulator